LELDTRDGHFGWRVAGASALLRSISRTGGSLQDDVIMRTAATTASKTRSAPETLVRLGRWVSVARSPATLLVASGLLAACSGPAPAPWDGWGSSPGTNGSTSSGAGASGSGGTSGSSSSASSSGASGSTSSGSVGASSSGGVTSSGGPSDSGPSSSSSSSGSNGGDAGMASGFDQFQAHNRDVINQYRATLNLPPLVLDAQLCVFALAGSSELSQDHMPHAHFMSAGTALWTQGFTTQAGENQGDPNGWPKASTDPTRNELTQIDQIQQAMFNEGPGSGESHGHYENIMSTTFTRLGVGLLEVNGLLYLTNDFSN
jgi:uncharacterized protein YkwD